MSRAGLAIKKWKTVDLEKKWWKMLQNKKQQSILSGQIIATSHDLTPNGGLVREIPLFQENPGWWNIIIWPDLFCIFV